MNLKSIMLIERHINKYILYDFIYMILGKTKVIYSAKKEQYLPLDG